MAVHERHYTPTELAIEWHLSVSTIRRWCNEHGGVIMIDRPEVMNKRGYRTIRIPETIAKEIYARHFVPRAKRNQDRLSYELAREQQTDGGLTGPPIRRQAPNFPAPEITIFTRHRRNCKYRRNEFFRGCDCPKSFSFTEVGILRTLRSGTPSWEDAEEMRRKAIGLVVTGERFDVSFAITDVRSQVLVSVSEAAAELDCTEEALHQVVERKGVPLFRFGRYAYVNRADLATLSGEKQEMPVK